jgi:hypothetical protein
MIHRVLTLIYKVLRRLVSSWAVLLLASVATWLFLCLPPIVRSYDPTAGNYDGGFVLWIGLGLALACIVLAASWIVWQLGFGSIDRATASKEAEFGHLEDWFHACTPLQKVLLTQGTFIFVICFVLYCLTLVQTK